MAKMINCPTCGTQIEVQQAAGQVIKCPGCGKGLKLVSKRPPGSPPREPGATSPGASSQGSLAGGTIAGGSISAMTYHGDPPPMDDMPSLDSSCAVCGRPTDPDQLIEDNGKLICRDCVKGARSRIDRPTGGTDLLEFKPPVPRPGKRGRIINFTPAFFAACLAGLVWGGCEIYLNLVERPRGSGVAIAKPVKPAKPTTVTPPEPTTTGPSVSNDPPATKPGTPDAAAAQTLPPILPPATTNPATNTAVAANTATKPPEESGFSLFPDPSDTTQPPIPAPPEVITPADPAVASSDPLERGLEKLVARDYDAALLELERARTKYVVRQLTATLTPQQVATINALAAARLGMYLKSPKPDALKEVKTLLDMTFTRGDRSRALVLNSAIAALAGPTPPLAQAQLADLVKEYMSRNKDDETAADIFGTMVNKLSTSTVAKDRIEIMWSFYDSYVDALGKQNDAGKLKWGVDWIAAEDVKAYRPMRSAAGTGGDVMAAAKEVKLAQQRVQGAENALKKAQADKDAGKNADLRGAQDQLTAASAAFTQAQEKLDAANAQMKYRKPRWLETFQPVIPTIVTGT
ncbi:MAG: hypothetical protein ABIP55_13165 [Tepidisphaeraceae bacterium]